MRYPALMMMLTFAACSICRAADETGEVIVGSKAPDFAVTGIDGQTLNLSTVTANGKKHVCLIFSRAHW